MKKVLGVIKAFVQKNTTAVDNVKPEDDRLAKAFADMSFKVVDYNAHYTTDDDDYPAQEDFTIALISGSNGHVSYDFAFDGTIVGYLPDEKHRIMGNGKPYSLKEHIAVGIPTDRYNSVFSMVKGATGYNLEKNILAESGGYTWLLADQEFLVVWYYNDGFADWRCGDVVPALIRWKQSSSGVGDFGFIVSKTHDGKWFLRLILKRFTLKKATEI